ncbi:hypothetical protein PENTCL1PPCAC_17915, partial [Pristionchus entomophagus]
QMWCPEDESFSTNKKVPSVLPSSFPHSNHFSHPFEIPEIPEWTTPDDNTIVLHSSNLVFKIPYPQVFASVSHLVNRSSPTVSTAFPPVHPDTPRPLNLKRTTNIIGDDGLERKIKKEEIIGMNTVFYPILPYVDLLKKEADEYPLCDFHLGVQRELEEHPEVMDVNGIDDGMGRKERCDDGSNTVEICAAFVSNYLMINSIECFEDESCTYQVDEALCNREMMRRRKNIQEIIHELSSVEIPSPLLISTFTSSLSESLLSMNGQQRQFILRNLGSSLLSSSGLPTD